MKVAYLYEYNDRLVLVPGSFTTQQFLITDSPVISVSSRDARDIGKALSAALAQSKSEIPHPASWKGLFDPVLRAVGAPSMKKFHKSAKCVVVEQSSAIVMKPLKNAGNGFVPTSKELICESNNADDCGQMALIALAEAS